ncbi:MAG: universal stress protein [Salinibacter sp.]|uniref:universal stress protein n=1 Tax=Salinibacter sp. TaxID=2065818 RepID=UPI002FC37985
MTDSISPPSSILVDVELPSPDRFPASLIEVLSPLRVVILGWFSVPEQTSPAQARDQFGAEAQDTLDAVARRFEDVGAEVTTRLVFTGEKFDTLTRISVEEDCDAVLIPGEIEHLRRVLVPLRGLENAHQIAPFVADLCRDATATVTLLHIVEEGETEADSRADVLRPAANRMRDHGLDTGLLELEAMAADDPADAIVDRAEAYDLVVLGETEPSVQEILFGTVPERIVTSADVPVIVVRHEDEAIEAAEQTMQAGSS